MFSQVACVESMDSETGRDASSCILDRRDNFARVLCLQIEGCCDVPAEQKLKIASSRVGGVLTTARLMAVSMIAHDFHPTRHVLSRTEVVARLGHTLPYVAVWGAHV